MKKQIQKRSILRGDLEKKFKDDENYVKSKEIKTPKSEEITLKNPFTGREFSFTLDRGGMTAEKLSLVLTDKEVDEDKKDAAISMYLFEKGMESASFLADIIRYKGQNTKEVRQFKSIMRFDFDNFISHFTNYLDGISNSIKVELGLDEWEGIKNRIIDFLNNEEENEKELGGKVKSIGKLLGISPIQSCLISIALRSEEESGMIKDFIRETTRQRERERGGGIYIDKHGRVHDLTEESFSDIVLKDIEDSKREKGRNKKDLK